jgi:hypothetical protein
MVRRPQLTPTPSQTHPCDRGHRFPILTGKSIQHVKLENATTSVTIQDLEQFLSWSSNDMGVAEMGPLPDAERRVALPYGPGACITVFFTSDSEIGIVGFVLDTFDVLDGVTNIG